MLQAKTLRFVLMLAYCLFMNGLLFASSPASAQILLQTSSSFIAAKSSACNEFSYVMTKQGGFPTNTEVSKLTKLFGALVVQDNQYASYYNDIQVLWDNASPQDRSDAVVLLTSFCDKNVTGKNLTLLTKNACLSFTADLDSRRSVQDLQYWTHNGLKLISSFANLYVLNPSYESVYNAAHFLAYPLTDNGDDMTKSIAVLKVFCGIR